MVAPGLRGRLMENILKRLGRGDVIVGDGALGTMLMQRGLKHGDPPEAFNLTRPNVLEEIASLYVAAGAEIITTNTFGASPLRLQQFFLDKETEAINRNAVDAVRRAVRGSADRACARDYLCRYVRRRKNDSCTVLHRLPLPASTA